MSRRLFVAAAGALLVLATSPTLAQPVADEALPRDLRMIEANSLLDEKDRYDRAISLYREVLADDPADDEARLWLARVLSWKGSTEASLVEYDFLLAGPNATREIAIERAEVLSWGGRYEDAEAAFLALLAEQPDDARAARGLARVYLWSGRKREAQQAFERALALEEDPDARQELDELTRGLGASGDVNSRYFSDSDGFELTAVTATSSFDWSFDTRLLLSATYTRIDQEADLLGRTFGANGFDALFGVEHSPIPGLRLSVEVGGRYWDEADDHFLARVRGQWSLPSNTALGFELEQGDFLSRSDSFEAVIAGLEATSLRGTVWQGYAGGFSTFFYLDTAFVSDGNTRVTGGGNGAWRPFREHELELGAALGVLTFTERSLLYYDPNVDFSASVSAKGFYPIPRLPWLGIDAEVRIGLGYAEQAGLEGFGFTYSVAGGPKIRRDGYWLSFTAARMQSQRTSTYTAHTFTLALGTDF